MKIELKDERGIASIYVTVIFSIIISILVLSFAIISRKEQRLALDRQLSSQAYYAAESGINYAVSKIKNNPNYLSDTCMNPSDILDELNSDISEGNDVYRTCVLVKATNKLTYDVNTSNSKFFLVRGQADLTNLTFKWSPINSTDTVISNPTTCVNTAGGCFKPDSANASDWGSQMGVLRLQIVAVPKNGSVTRNLIPFNTYDLIGIPETITNNKFITPNYISTVSPTDVPSDGNSSILSGGCNTTTKECSLIVDKDSAKNVPRLNNGSYDYYVRAFSYYKDIKLSVTGAMTTNSEAIFVGSQVEIDSTGRSGDVLRRIKVNKTINTSDSFSSSSSTSFMPPFVVSVSDGLCKKLDTNLSGTTVANPAAVCN